MRQRVAVVTVIVALFAAAGPWGGGPIDARAVAEQCFPETGRCVSGLFYAYWTANGGLAQQGFPITDEFDEVSPTDGKTYKTQYFERARFEHHPENNPPFDVLLGLLGREQFLAKYPNGRPPTTSAGDGDRCFAETGRCVGGLFYEYWAANGGLAQQGYPLSDQFDEVSPTNGKTYRVQYFERARFEHHPENAAPYNVLLGLLGREQLPPNNPQAVADTRYTSDTSPTLRNPERGMYFGSTPNTPGEFHTIVPEWLWLAPVCNVNLSWNGYNQTGTSAVLNAYAKKLGDARKDGYKILFRPRYDKEPGGKASDCTINGAKVFHADSKARQYNHIDAVAAMLGDYKDVIAYIQAGYLGNWGEWNAAGKDERGAAYTPANAPLLYSYTDRRDIIDRVLSAYAAEGIAQDVELRTPVFAKEVVARNSSANIGLHNDCFMSSNSDTGTYSDFPGSPQNFGGTALAKEWAEDWTENSSFGGETCPTDPPGSERWRSCSNMTSPTGDPAKLHLSYLNAEWASDAVSVWAAGGCYDEIRRKLGYRFEVTRVDYTPTVAPGQTFTLRVEVANTGWAKLQKPRQAKLVLRNGATTRVYDISAGAVASWAPGQTTTLSINAPAPSAGTYSVRLWIPDPDVPPGATQETKSRYAVKLATLRNGANVFDPTTGENDLGVSIVVPDTANLGTLNVTVRKCTGETCTGHKAYLYLTYPTGEILPAETDAAGKYSFIYLKPGAYKVESTIQANGRAYSLIDPKVSVIAGQTKARTYDIDVP